MPDDYSGVMLLGWEVLIARLYSQLASYDKVGQEVNFAQRQRMFVVVIHQISSHRELQNQQPGSLYVTTFIQLRHQLVRLKAGTNDQNPLSFPENWRRPGGEEPTRPAINVQTGRRKNHLPTLAALPKKGKRTGA